MIRLRLILNKEKMKEKLKQERSELGKEDLQEEEIWKVQRGWKEEKELGIHYSAIRKDFSW